MFRSRCIPRLAAALAIALAATGLVEAADLPSPSMDGVAQALVRRRGVEGRVLWLDATANLERLSTREGVAAVMEKSARAGFNTVVVDVKPLSGEILYVGEAAPRLKEWKGFAYPAEHDLLQVALEEGHRRGLTVCAAVNVFSAGHKLVGQGPVLSRIEDQSVIYDIERTVVTPRGERRRLALGENRAIVDDLCLYDSSYRQPRMVAPGEAFARVQADRVDAVVDGGLAPPGGVPVPRDGYLIVGKGPGAAWILRSIRVGDMLSWWGNDRLVPIAEAPSEPVAAFVNPADPTWRESQWRVAEEIAGKYPVDGIVFDRMRYAGIQSDFGPLTRQKFEEHVGGRLNRFPGDVYSIDPTPNRPILPGAYYKQWLEWRARNIRTWLEDAARRVRARRPGTEIAAYVGSWYPTYYQVGVNWASEAYRPEFEWATPTYPTTGYAAVLDWLTTGCYHPVATRDQAKQAGLNEEYTVQAAAERSRSAIGDQAFFYAGIYVQDYRGSAESFRGAIRCARENSQGIMLFDLSQIEEYGWWPIIEAELGKPVGAPHQVPDLLSDIRSLRQVLNGAARTN